MKVRPIIFLIALQLLMLYSTGQEFRFKCLLRSKCSDTLKELDEYTLRKGDKYYYSLNLGNIIAVADTGTYILESSKIDAPVRVQINQEGLNIDTLQEVSIYQILLLDGKKQKKKSGNWVCCGKPCNGLETDYYANGKKRMEGKFRNGLPIEKVLYYDDMGKLLRKVKYDKYGKVELIEKQ